jgi:hypothetical protein
VKIFGNDSNKSKFDWGGLRGDWILVMLATVQSRTFLCSHLLSKNVKIRIYVTIFLPMVLYGCGTWSPTLREEHTDWGLFQKRVLKRTFGLKRDEVLQGWRKPHNVDLHNLYTSPSKTRMIKSRRMRWSVHVACMRQKGMHIGIWWESLKEINH